MHNRKSIFCYLLATIAASVSGCDDLYWDSSLYDLYGKKDGTLNWCGTYDSDGQIVHKGDVVKLIKLVDNKRYEYTCPERNSDNTCAVMELKICDNDDINKECVESPLDDHKLSKEEKLYKTSFRNHACPTSFTCRNVLKTNDTNSNQNSAPSATPNEEDYRKSENEFECILAKCGGTTVDLRDKNRCGGCNIDCTSDNQVCDDGRCIPILTCEENELTCKCTGSVADGTFECSTPDKGEIIPKDKLVCIDNTTDKMCGIKDCTEFKGIEKCSIGKHCKTESGSPQCVCSEGTFEVEGGSCVGPHSNEHCGIKTNEGGVKCDPQMQLCNGEKCVCSYPFYQCDPQSESPCVNLSDDPKNCGFCGNDCTTKGTGAQCINSKCVCPDNNIMCNGKCIDPNTDNTYCGANNDCKGDASGKTCGENQKCMNKKCECIDDFFEVNIFDDSMNVSSSKCINFKSKNYPNYDKYCGANASNPNVYQDCTEIPNAACISTAPHQFHCSCVGNYFPYYTTDENNVRKLKTCVSSDGEARFCAFDSNTQDYMDCYKSCGGEDESHCNPDISKSDVWDCIDNKCAPKCGNDKVKCKKRFYNQSTGELEIKDGFICLNKKLVESSKDDLCNCAACPSTDADEVCLPVISPETNIGSDPTATVPTSLNHCSSCYDSCPKQNYTQCVKTILTDNNSYKCRCNRNEIEVYFDNKMYCIPEDYSSYNILCNENGGKTVCACAQGYLNIDNDFKNGCERHVANDLEFCGKGGLNINHTNCNDYLEENHAHLTDCNAGTCVYQSCMQGYGNCNGKLDDGCELALSSTKNCGECGKTCNLDCFTALQCKNKCSKSNESEQYTCCVEGEISKKHTLNQIKCCEGLKPYRFNQKWGSICTFSDHYGCFKSAPEGLYKSCWTEVTAGK